MHRGTTITIYLPTVDGESAPKPSTDRQSDQGHDGLPSRRILVVEDNHEVGSFATQLLNDLGYTTTWVDNATEALRLIEADPAAFDLVFSDVVMPGGVSGVDLANELRRRWPHLPVVLTSGYSEVLAEGGASEYELLRKPYSVEALSRLIRNAIGPGQDGTAMNRS